MESVLEIQCNRIYSTGHLRTNSWAIGNCSNLPSAYGSLSLRPSWCGAIYGDHYPSLRIQQFYMVTVGCNNLCHWQLIK